MPAYFIADITVEDMEAYRTSGYLEAVPDIAAKYGGVYRVRGGTLEVIEGNWSPARMVVIEFPSMEKAQAFYNCEEYAPYLAIRHKLAVTNSVLVDGV